MRHATPLPWHQDPEAAAGKFGFAVDNTIGGTPQPNGWMDSWVDFYRERRLRHQLDLLGGLSTNALPASALRIVHRSAQVPLLQHALPALRCCQAAQPLLPPPSPVRRRRAHDGPGAARAGQPGLLVQRRRGQHHALHPARGPVSARVRKRPCPGL